MAVPASVKTMLDNQTVAYSVFYSPEPEAVATHKPILKGSTLARSMILQDKQGPLQVIFPADCLIDINQVNQLLARNLRPLKPNDLTKLYAKYFLKSVPALPKLGGMPTLVEKRLFEQESVLLDSGAEDILKMDQQSFTHMANGVDIREFGVPLKGLQEKYEQLENDEEKIFSAVKSFTSLRIKQRLEDTLEFPPLPNTAQKIIKLRVDPQADVSDLAEIVELDPSLAAQVVSWAASPYYSAPGKIRSIHDAIVRVLGFDMVLNLSLGLSLGRTLKIPDESSGVTPYWEQSVFMAAAVEGLVTAVPREFRPGFGMSYLSGLLHNFGWLILAEVFPPHFVTIEKFAQVNTHVPHYLIETHVLGVTRDQLASWLMECWHMPEEVVYALRFHNMQPRTSDDHGIYATLLHVARRLLREQGIGFGPEEPVTDECFKTLHLNPEKARGVIETVMESSEELNNIARQLAG